MHVNVIWKTEPTLQSAAAWNIMQHRMRIEDSGLHRGTYTICAYHNKWGIRGLHPSTMKDTAARRDSLHQHLWRRLLNGSVADLCHKVAENDLQLSCSSLCSTNVCRKWVERCQSRLHCTLLHWACTFRAFCICHRTLKQLWQCQCWDYFEAYNY